MLVDKPLDFEILRSLANGARDWLDQSNIIAMCWSKVLKFRVPERTFEACSQKALTFLTERVFSRELRHYGRSPVVQCQRFLTLWISKPDHYCRCNCYTICSCSFNFNITLLNADLRQGHNNNSHYCERKLSGFSWLVSWRACGFYHFCTQTFH